MTESQPAAAQPTATVPFDASELMQLPVMTRGEIGNLMACLDATVRSQGLQAAKVLAELADRLSKATPAETQTAV